MKLFQIKLDDSLRKAIDEKATQYGVSATSLVRIALVNTFVTEKKTGEAKAIYIDDIISGF